MCRRLALAGLAVIGAVAGTPALAAPFNGFASRVTIRIHDYARVRDLRLQAAQEHVSDTYARIGVNTDWLPPLRPSPTKAPSGAYTPEPEDASIVLMLITEPMADRLRVPVNVAGYAATDGQSVGSVAFIVADRVDRVAWRGRLNPGQVLGSVIAHELAHLLMPGRHHSSSGIMRPRWTVRDFESSDIHTFADEEVVAIRRSVAGLARQHAARVAD